MFWVWRWLTLVVALTATTALPVPDETDTSTKLLGSSVVTSVSVVMGHEDGVQEKSDTRKATEDLPPSTVDMLKPDGFQFYTVDEKGQLITRQMTDSEIQSIIAAGGGPFPMESQDPQKDGDNMTGEMKVADVVQNVKNVLKDEMNKPAPAMGTVPTIPGHANDEWSSILPSILGGESESAPVTIPEVDSTPMKEMVKQNVSRPETNIEKLPAPETPEAKPQEAEKAKPTETETEKDEMVKIEQKQPEFSEIPEKTEQPPAKETQEIPERPMIQVPVITADSVQATTKGPEKEAENPVYQILNTISVEEVKDQDTQTSEEAKPENTATIAEITSATEKEEMEVKKPEEVTEELQTTSSPASVETIVDMEMSSSLVPGVQEESDKPEAPEETEVVKVPTPSITLEAPVAEEKPVEAAVTESEKKEPMEITTEVKPVEEDETEKKPAVVQETESTTLRTATIEEEVSEMVNLMPESVSSIVEELISESSNALTEDAAKPEAPEASTGVNDPKKPEASATEDATKAQESTKPESSEEQVTPAVLEDTKIPETEAEPVFEMLPEISPDSTATKTEAETPVPEAKPETTEVVPETIKIVPEVTVSGDKIEQQIESAQSMTPVMEAAMAVTEKNDESKTETTSVEKKPETLLTELADSVSSMISQVSEVMPSMVPIPQKTESSEPPVKRVEDGVKGEAAKPLVPDVELPSKEETTKPEKTEPEMIMVEVKTPEPTTVSSILDASETMKISDQVSTDPIPETMNDKMETTETKASSDAEKTEAPAPEEEKTEKVEVNSADSENTKISASSSDQEPVKAEETVSPKPEDSKPEEAEEVAKDETKTEVEAPIVRIDISEVKPTESDLINDDSSVVRIQLTNTVSEVNQMIDSVSEVVPTVEVEDISLPEKTVLEASAPQNIGSSLIAGAQGSDVAEIETPENLPQLETAASASSEILEDPKPTEITNAESDTKESSEKSQPEIEEAKIPEAEVTQATISEETKTPMAEIEVLTKTTESSDESKLEKPTETEIPKETAAPVEKEALPVEPVVKIDAPVAADEKIEAPTKSEDQEKPAQTPEKIVETVTVVSEVKIEKTEAPEPVKAVEEPSEVPAVQETPTMLPPEVVISTTMEIEPTKESPEMIKDEVLEPAKSEEKPEETSTKIVPEAVSDLEKAEEKKPEVQDTVTKISEAPIQSNENMVPVELATPVSTQPEVQPSDPVPEVSTKKTEESEAQKETESPTIAQTDGEVQNTESTEKNDVKNEMPAKAEGGDVSQTVAEPEEVKIEDSKSPSVGDEPEKKIPIATIPEKTDVKESAVPEKEQTPVPLVRIDVSPEKNQTESSTTKMQEIPDSTIADDKKTETPETSASTEINLSAVDDSMKKTDKPEEDPAVETSGAQSVEPETVVSSSESPKTPVVEETKVQMPAAKEPEVSVKQTEESVEETVSIVDSKLPEVTTTVEMTSASPTAAKIENDNSAKPGVRIDTTPNDGPVKTQEVRIQVNDTAVLVTKQKIPQKAGSDEKKVLPTEIPDSVINRVEASSQTPEKIETTSQQPQKIEEPTQEPEKMEVPSQEPEKAEVLIQPSKIPVVEKPAPVSNTEKTTSKKEEEKVKTESTSEQKKPLVDPYVKLGEKKPEQKPVESNTAKVPISVSKKPTSTEANKDSIDKWTLIPQSEPYPVIKQQTKPLAEEPTSTVKNEDLSVPLEAHKSAVSLAESTRDQDEDISSFSKLCNELAFSFWVAANKGLSTARSLALSPFGMTSMLAMVFLGARGPTSGQMNDILKLDDVVTFNPHLVFQNVTDSVNLARGQGIANAAFVRELFADRIKAGRLLPFYKERAQQFYDGHVEEVNFATISDLVRRRTNLLIRRQTGGRIRDFVKGNVMPLRSPLAALSANVFQTDCTGASSEGRDGEMYFAVLPAVRQRKLVPVPATVWRSGVLAGYEPGLDATVISLGGVGNLVSTIFVLPGQQGLAAPGDSLDHLERRLLEGAFTDGVWDRLIRVLIPRMGLEVQVPKFSHRSVVNATAALKRMGLDDLFSKHADLKGINGVGNDLHLADMLQINLFSTCGDEVITGGRHHVEIYPASPLRGARIEKKPMEAEDQEKEEEEEKETTEEKEVERTKRSLKVGEYLEKRSTSLSSEKQLIEGDREAEDRSQRASTSNKELLQLSKGKQNERPLLKLDRPFLYFVRHNPTGMILHMGRFNPRLMP